MCVCRFRSYSSALPITLAIKVVLSPFVPFDKGHAPEGPFLKRVIPVAVRVSSGTQRGSSPNSPRYQQVAAARPLQSDRRHCLHVREPRIKLMMFAP